MININPTTANFPGLTYTQAVGLAHKMKSNWANIITEHMQLCPQQMGKVDDEVCDKIMTKFPHTQFRCHANVKLFDNLHIFDASCEQNLIEHEKYLKLLAQIIRRLKSSVYSVHAGRRNLSLNIMRDNIYRLEDTLKVPVAVEGLYPNKTNEWLINSWNEYEWLLKSDLKMAIDLSHLQIVAHQEQYWPENLVRELLTSPNCLEIHVAGNDEIHDNHQQVVGDEKWIQLLDNISHTAVIFTEENQRKKLIKRK